MAIVVVPCVTAHAASEGARRSRKFAVSTWRSRYNPHADQRPMFRWEPSGRRISLDVLRSEDESWWWLCQSLTYWLLTIGWDPASRDCQGKAIYRRSRATRRPWLSARCQMAAESLSWPLTRYCFRCVACFAAVTDTNLIRQREDPARSRASPVSYTYSGWLPLLARCPRSVGESRLGDSVT